MRNSVIKPTAGELLETELANYFIDENDVLHIIQKKIEITAKIISDNFEKVDKLIAGRKMLMFCDTSDSLNYDKKSRLAFEEQSAKCCLALALFSNNKYGINMGNVFLAMRRTAYPMRLFNDKEKAMTWLLNQV